MYAVSLELCGAPRPGTDLPVRKDIKGIGFRDQANYARHLSRATDYTNSFLHKTPRRDVMDLASFGGLQYDYAVCSEVLEHVGRPPEAAIENMYAILKPGGFLVLTVPFKEGATREHFPPLDAYDIAKVKGEWTLTGTTKDGARYTANDLVFHGGPGSTLEMRVWGRDSLHAALSGVGFTTISEDCESHSEFGVFVDPPGLGPVGIWTARK